VKDFPIVSQRKSFDCSAACAKAVDEHYRVLRPLAHYVNSLSAEKTSGCDPRTLERFFRKSGYGVIAGEMTLADLRFHTSLERPVITPITLDGEGHYVVVYRVSRRLGSVWIADPWSGPCKMPGAAFVAAWRDHDAVETFTRWGIAVGIS
jgi:ABC-type bacteriocin/lantibiotic exporter with double-glycine peptidase domain